jgi:glycosyltransferase involved in cell wall biosynthesis
MPSKLYGLLAIGKPIIAVSAPDSEVADILRQSGAGVQVGPDDPDMLADEIVRLLDDPDHSLAMGKRGRKYFLENFERRIVTAQWARLLREMGKTAEGCK